MRAFSRTGFALSAAGTGFALDRSVTGVAPKKKKFNPLMLSPAAWYDPSDFSTMFQDVAGTTPVTTTGQAVARINDKSGNAHHLTGPGIAGTWPTLQQASGKYYLSFDGVDDYLKSAGWTAIAQPLDRVSAIQQDTWGANRYMMDGGVGDQLILRQNGVTPQLAIYAGLAAGTNGAATLGAPCYAAERYNGATSSLTLGSTTVTGDAGAQAATGLTVGGHATGALFCPFKFFGLVMRGGTFTAQDLTNLHVYLSGKSGAA